ncbi:MAG: hypothetical protein GY768_13235 [Planctomycetaceae bacterium]|nr:hypothetical protein [Planctomycetaceae bacterium]
MRELYNQGEGLQRSGFQAVLSGLLQLWRGLVFDNLSVSQVLYLPQLYYLAKFRDGGWELQRSWQSKCRDATANGEGV